MLHFRPRATLVGAWLVCGSACASPHYLHDHDAGRPDHMMPPKTVDKDAGDKTDPPDEPDSGTPDSGSPPPDTRDSGMDSGTDGDAGKPDAGDDGDAGGPDAMVPPPPCAQGFHHEGADCVDDDECAAHPCDADPGADCHNAEGTFSCACPDGFDGDGLGAKGCTPLLSALSALPAELGAPFAATTPSYSARVAPWIAELEWQVTAPASAVVHVGDTQVQSGVAQKRALAFDAQKEVVSVEAGGTSRTYELTFERKEKSQYLKATDPMGGSVFGTSIAMTKDLVAVGAPLEDSNGTSHFNTDATDSGATYVFHRDEHGVYREEGYLKPKFVLPGMLFGTSLSMQGSRLVIGAKYESSDGVDRSVANLKESGAAYVFERDANGQWSEVAYLKAPTPMYAEHFGSSVALDGDLIAVGAPHDLAGLAKATNTPRDPGTVYIFHRQADGSWAFEHAINAADSELWDAFGFAVSLSGTRLAVSAPWEDGSGISRTDNNADRSGAVYVFERGDDQSWPEQQYIKPDVVRTNTIFGFAISLHDDRLAVGAPREASNGSSPSNPDAPLAGAAFMFERQSNGKYLQMQYLKEKTPGSNEFFGRALTLDETGELLLVGADQSGSHVSAGHGQVTAMRKNAEGKWTQVALLSAPNGDPQDQFGYAVATWDGRIAASARQEASDGTDPTNNSLAGSGAFYVLE